MPRVAIVTGGAGGLGAALVRRLAADGLAVAIADVDGAAAEALSAGVAGSMAVPVDVTSIESVGRMVEEVLERLGGVDVLVNNAGVVGPSAPVVEYPLDEWQRVVEVNLNGVFRVTRACLPHMLERGSGRVVNVASIAGKEGNPRLAAYSASKGGVIAFTKAVAKEVARTGVLVNCVAPGIIDAGLGRQVSDEERALFESWVPMGRMGRPEEFAELVAWLSSPACSFSTGATYDLSGGRAVY
jgi:2-dehydro-3-deoxy-L-rhamnonate dehydrogenase (NAD+)